MQFQLTEEQKLIRETVRSFAEAEVLPSAAERDEEERFDRELMFDKVAELGLTGIVFPEEYGGAGADYISYAIAVEELSRVCASTGVTLSAHLSLGANPIYMFGTEEQKKKFLIPLAEGSKMGAFALTEPSAGSDAGGTRATATLDGDEWVLNGTKNFITNSKEGDTYIVFARSDKEAQKHHGISAFIVEKGTPGFSFGKKELKMGIRSSLTYELVFEDCRIPKDNLLGEEGKGFKIGMKTLDGGRIGIAAQALGIAQGALDASLEYVKDRKQFNQTISSFQAIQFKLADMALELKAANLLTWEAGWKFDQGTVTEADMSMAKLKASEMLAMVADEAIQIHGGMGLMDELPLERIWRDARVERIWDGTSEIQRHIISRELLRALGA